MCGKPVEQDLFGVVHVGEAQSDVARRPHPDDAAVYDSAVAAATAELRRVPGVADPGALATAAVWGIYRAGHLRRRGTPRRNRAPERHGPVLVH